METLAMRGNVVPFGAAGICCAVSVEVFSLIMNSMLSRENFEIMSNDFMTMRLASNSDVARTITRGDINLTLDLEFPWSSIVYKTPDFISALHIVSKDDLSLRLGSLTRSGTNTSPLNSSDMWGFEGPPFTGNSTTGESFWKCKGSPGTVATREQLGDPN